MLDVWRRAHGPTWLAAVAIYGGWALLTLAHDRIPLPLLALLGGAVIAWQGSLQHETIHGHPGGPAWVRYALGAPPLALWLPYEIYRDTHRRHHATPHLADPAHDPEAPARESALGRLVLGPPLTVARFLRDELRISRAWAIHLATSALVVAWLVYVAHLPLWEYVLLFVYPGTSLTLLRSFAEHRHDPVPERRTAAVEAGLFFRLVFMNNNFHIAHHASPRAPWFELPRIWRAQRAAVSPDLIHPGYLAIVRRRLWR